MKTYTLFVFFFFSLGAFAQNSSLPNYKMLFQYRNGSGQLRDTMVPRIKYKVWSRASTYPSYVKWKNQHFAVLRSSIDAVGLFTDSTSSFSTGQEIGYAFFKIGSSGHFDLDYLETNLGSFINDSDNPNIEVVKTSTGIVIKAKQNIVPNTELVANYQDLINLFPNDESVNRAIKYW
jgi:hypothetical protein